MQPGSTFEKRSISEHLAQRMAHTARQKAAEISVAIAVAIVDESGILKAFLRMDGSPLVAVHLAQKKAVTAVCFGLSTGSQWYEFIKDDPILLHGAQSIDQFTMLGGGFPIVVEDRLVGGIGVSGGHYRQDIECAEAALSLVG